MNNLHIDKCLNKDAHIRKPEESKSLSCKFLSD